MKRVFLVLVCCLFGPFLASAAELEAPTGPVLLTVTGKVGVANDGEAALFDLAMLEALQDASFQTTTPWTEGVVRFEGVRLSTFLQAIGVIDGTLKMSAINDYSVDVPVSDAVDDGPILALRRNGELMRVRDKGPIWLIYPFDLKKEYRSQTNQTRSIWQLDRIEVKQ